MGTIDENGLKCCRVCGEDEDIWVAYHGYEKRYMCNQCGYELPIEIWQAACPTKTPDSPKQPDSSGENEGIDATDWKCIERDFEEWVSLPPYSMALDLEKDGDGEYENEAARQLYRCFEYAYQKGLWGAARKIDQNMISDIARYQAELTQFLNGTHESLHVTAERLLAEIDVDEVAADLRNMNNWLIKDEDGDTCENYNGIAATVIASIKQQLDKQGDR